MQKQPLLNTYVNNVTLNETIEQIEWLIADKKKSYVVAINVDVVIKIENDEYLKKITDDADMVLVDGKPLIWISKLHKRPIKKKYPVQILFRKFVKEQLRKNIPFLLLEVRMELQNRQKRN